MKRETESLSQQGLSQEGLSQEGLSQEGLSQEGLSQEGLSQNHLRGLLDQLLDEGMAVELRVTGQSMSPFIRGGDLTTLVPLRDRAPRRGEVIAFLSEGRHLMIHRVVEINGEKIRTRGDGLRRDDAAILATDVLALVTETERDGKRHRLGFRREGAVIAWLSDHDWLVPLLAPLRLATKMWQQQPKGS